MEYNCFTPSEHDENWSHGDDLCGAADAALDDYLYELSIPWLRKSGARDWEPNIGMTILIGAGNSSRIKWSEVAPDIADIISERMYDHVGEASDCINLPADLQIQFEAWLCSVMGSEHAPCYTIENVTSISVVYDGGSWCESEQAK